MMDQKFIDRIEDLRHHTYSRITEIQRNLCPMVKNIYLNYQFDYWYDGYEDNLWEEDTHLYAVKEIPYCYDNDLKNTVFMDTLDHLVEQDKVWPFLLFINGLAIKWSNITIIHDYDYSYMKIHDFVPNYSTDATIIVFPIGSKNIRYGEDSNILTDINRKGLYFKNGKFIEDTNFVSPDGIDLRLEITLEDVYFKKIDLMSIESSILKLDIPEGYIPTIDNVISFSEDGLFNHDGPSEFIEDIYKGAFNIFKFTPIDKSKSRWAFMMYVTHSGSHNSSEYKKYSSKLLDDNTPNPDYNKEKLNSFNSSELSKQSSSLYEREDLDREKIFKLLALNQDTTSELWNKLIAPLIQNFDFDHEFGVPYEENLSNAAKYITQYDFRLWKDAFTKDLNIKSFYYTGKDFKALADGNGHLHISRKHSKNIEDVVIMFVNHRLYDYMIDVKYKTNSIDIPIFGIYDDDHIEIIMFTKCNNNILDITVKDNSTPVYIHPEYNLEDCYLMSEYCPDCEYNVPESIDQRKQYIVDFNYEFDGSDYIITFKNTEYYGKKLKVVPKHQFRYYRYKKRDEKPDCKVILPTQFNYCHDPDRFLIFVNGKKIDRTEYTVSIMNKYRPFDKLILYVSTLLDKGDYIDIFYIPEVLVEKHRQASIDKSGLLMLIDEETGVNYPTTYPMSKDTVMLFINGLKVNPLDIKDLSLNSMLIDVDMYKRNKDNSIMKDGNGDPIINPHHVNSLDNITVIEYVAEDKEISGYLNGLYQQIPEGYKYQPEKIDFNKPASDRWKVLINSIINGKISGISLDSIYPNFNDIISADKNYKDDYADLRSVLYDAVVDYYLSRGAYTGAPFVYDFERDHFDGQPPKEDIKIIKLFGERDKLFEYTPTDQVANPEDVVEGKTFMDPNGL